MRILHLTYKANKGNVITDYISTLVENQKQQSMEVAVAYSEKEFNKMFATFQPDIVHIHKCWDLNTYLCAKKAINKGCALLLSPHGELFQFAMESEKAVRKDIKRITYQQKMVQLVDALLVFSEKEKHDVEKLKWNNRIDIVPSCLFNSNISAQEMAEKVILIYTKIIHTRYRKYMTTAEFQSICTLLHKGLQQDENYKIIPTDRLLELHNLTPQQWQRIFLFADDENIRNYIDIGISLLKLSPTNIDSQSILRYLAYMPKAKETLNKKEAITTNYFSRERIENANEREEEPIKSITFMMANAKFLSQQKRLSLQHLSEIYLMIRFEDYDEDQLAVVLKQMHLLKFGQRMMQILTKNLFLERGYTPFPPIDDKKTLNIIKNFINKEEY